MLKTVKYFLPFSVYHRNMSTMSNSTTNVKFSEGFSFKKYWIFHFHLFSIAKWPFSGPFSTFGYHKFLICHRDPQATFPFFFWVVEFFYGWSQAFRNEMKLRLFSLSISCQNNQKHFFALFFLIKCVYFPLHGCLSSCADYSKKKRLSTILIRVALNDYHQVCIEFLFFYSSHPIAIRRNFNWKKKHFVGHIAIRIC